MVSTLLLKPVSIRAISIAQTLGTVIVSVMKRIENDRFRLDSNENFH